MRLHDVRISRIGEMLYSAGQTPIPVGPDGVARVTRDAAVVFDQESLQSWVGKPVTIKHPPALVGPETWDSVAHGHIENVRRGEPPYADFMVGDVLLTKPDAIKLADDGCEISSGYSAAYDQTGVGRGKQTKIVGNHLAFLPDGIKGRCGPLCYVGDQSMDLEETTMTTDKTKLLGGASFLRKLFSAGDEAAVAAVLDQAIADEHAATVTGLQATIDSQAAEIVTLKATVEKMTKDAEDDDGEDDEDAEGKKKTPTADAIETLRPRIAAAAEILMPGTTLPTADAAGDLTATFDALCNCQRDTLAKAYATADGKVAIDAIVGGDPKGLTTDEANATFFAAAALMGMKNNGAIAAMLARQAAGSEIQTNIDRSKAADEASKKRWAERRAAQNNIH